jgi:hypothetical protein
LDGFHGKLAIERWNIDGAVFLEFSSRADPQDLNSVAARLKAFVESLGIKQSANPTSKTDFLLKHFAEK